MRQPSHRISNLLTVRLLCFLSKPSEHLTRVSASVQAAREREREREKEAHFTVVIGNECSGELGKHGIHKQEHYLLGISVGSGTKMSI